jgi:hypothetical protein
VFHSEVPEGTENNPDVIYERMKDAEQVIVLIMQHSPTGG